MRTRVHWVIRKQWFQIKIDPEARNGIRADENFLNGNDFG